MVVVAGCGSRVGAKKKKRCGLVGLRSAALVTAITEGMIGNMGMC
jgi:hypothetical protein